MEKQKFQPNSQILLIEPSALGLDFILAGPGIAAPFELVGNAAIVKINGPLSYSNFLFDSYESIKARVAAACASEASTVILRIASPGGDVAGAFDCARAIKKLAKSAGKRLITYTDEHACSAAYAIMCVGDELCASVTGKVGHIGAIAQYAETTAADKAQGITYNTLTTGDLKAAGNPHVQMSEDTRAALQAQLQQAGDVFYALVAEHRPLSAAAIQALQAGTFLGEAAKSVGLIDAVYSWDELLAYVESLGTIQASALLEEASKDMPDQEDKKDAKAKAEDKEDKKEDMKSILAKAAAAGDAKAAKALKAYESDDKEDKAAAEEPKKDEAKAEFPPKKDEKDDKESKALSALAAELASFKSENAALKARFDAQDKAKADAERSAFFASVGASEALIKGFEGLPLEQCKAILSAGSPVFKSQATELSRLPSQGQDPRLAEGMSDNHALNVKMGLVQYEPSDSATFDGVVQTFGQYQEKK